MLAVSRFLGSAVLLAVLALIAPPASAQCGPDGLDSGPCCSNAFVTLPQFPAMQTDVRWLCFNGCNTAQNIMYCANVGVPVGSGAGGQLLCGVYDIRFRLKTCGTTNFLWNGALKAHYSRTWNESSIPGTVNLQVWRFVVNGDLLPTTLLPTGICIRPACLNNFSRLYVSGYIDYAFDCVNGGWQTAFALSHECDSIHHAPGTARPAPASGFHGTRSWSIVGPGSTFVPSTATGGPRSDGAITGESMRWNRWNPAPQTCAFDEPANGSFVAGNEFCFCSATGPGQYINTTVVASGTCNSSVSPDPNGPFMQKRIGGWTSATQYPGQEFVLFDFGFLRHVNGCTGVNTTQWFEGAETVGGYFSVALTGLLLDPEFEDLGSCNNAITNPAIKIGAPHISDYQLQFNLP